MCLYREWCVVLVTALASTPRQSSRRLFLPTVITIYPTYFCISLRQIVFPCQTAGFISAFQNKDPTWHLLKRNASLELIRTPRPVLNRLVYTHVYVEHGLAMDCTFAKEIPWFARLHTCADLHGYTAIDIDQSIPVVNLVTIINVVARLTLTMTSGDLIS